MRHVLELVIALLGCCAVATGSLCVFRFGQANECPPGLERLSPWLVGAGVLAVMTSFLLVAWG